MEVIEHVADPGEFLRDCAQLLEAGGLMIVATLNRTLKAFALAKVGGVRPALAAAGTTTGPVPQAGELRDFLAQEPLPWTVRSASYSIR